MFYPFCLSGRCLSPSAILLLDWKRALRHRLQKAFQGLERCMPVDKQFQDIIEMYSHLPSLADLPLEQLRSAIPVNPAPTPVDAVRDRSIAGPGGDLKLRIYRSGSSGALPLLLFMHGGGFVLGNLDSHDEMARILTANTGCVTVAVDYRLAPEHPFPAAVDDCFAALNWAAANAQELGVDAGRLVVIGDSAGGNLAAVTALRARDEKGPGLTGQVLLYPSVNLTAPMLPAPDGEFYILSPQTRKFFNGAYLRDPAHASLPYVSPGLADDLRGLPPTLLITAEYDPLCSQGATLAARLQQAGVDTLLTRYDGAIHGFATFPVPMRDQALLQIAEWLKLRYA
jgi:acetyl esterase